jgi:hypothetical protein
MMTTLVERKWPSPDSEEFMFTRSGHEECKFGGRPERVSSRFGPSRMSRALGSAF